MDKKLEDNIKSELIGSIQSDDSQSLLQLIKCHDIGDASEILEWCLTYRAKSCAIALLKGGGIMLQANEEGTNALQIAVSFPELCVPEIVEPLLKDCGAAAAAAFANQLTPSGLLPLHIALVNVTGLNLLAKWFPGQSLIKLVIILFMPEARPLLESVKLIAEETLPVNKVALGFIEHSEIEELAALLIVAHGKVLAPFSSGETIIESIAHGHRKLGASADGVGLIWLFKKAGDALSRYFWSIHKDVAAEEIIFEVGCLIKKAGFPLRYDDLDVSDACCVEPSVISNIGERIGLPKDATSRELPQNIHYPSITVVEEGTEIDCADIRFKPRVSFPPRPHFRTQGLQRFSVAPSHEFISGMPKYSRAYSSSTMAYLAMKLKRVARLLR